MWPFLGGFIWLLLIFSYFIGKYILVFSLFWFFCFAFDACNWTCLRDTLCCYDGCTPHRVNFNIYHLKCFFISLGEKSFKISLIYFGYGSLLLTGVMVLYKRASRLSLPNWSSVHIDAPVLVRWNLLSYQSLVSVFSFFILWE